MDDIGKREVNAIKDLTMKAIGELFDTMKVQHGMLHQVMDIECSIINVIQRLEVVLLSVGALLAQAKIDGLSDENLDTLIATARKTFEHGIKMGLKTEDVMREREEQEEG